jgi:hypothetical protein
VQTVAVDANSRKEICGKMKLGDFNRGRTARLCVTHGGSGDLRIFVAATLSFYPQLLF